MSPHEPEHSSSHRHHRSSRSHRKSHSRSRSRSPDTNRDSKHRHHRDRHHHRHHRRHGHDHDRDRDRHHRSHDRRERSKPTEATPSQPVVLPLQARELSKRDLPVFAPMFAMYLDIQKGIIMEELPEEEVKGRWKSFIRKWNRGELVEGWYDPSTLEKARQNAEEYPPPPSAAQRRRSSPDYQDEPSSAAAPGAAQDAHDDNDEDEDDDEYGPGVPIIPQGGTGALSGPAIPTMQDLALRKEMAMEDAIADRHDSRNQHREEVRSHRKTLRHMEDEVAPRAEPGTHERRMEKRRETAAANRAFANARGGSPVDAAPDDELMGSGENDLDAIKKSKETEQRKKNEREIRREEILRARAAEREERLQQYRQKEEETIGWLKTLAKQRFG